MKVILVCQKSEFDTLRLKELSTICEVKWINSDITKLEDIVELQDNEEKILALSPVPIQWTFPLDFYAKLKNVKYICLPTTSYKFIQPTQCAKYGITLTNVPYYATDSVSEQAITILFSLLKRIPEQIKTDFKYEFNDYVLGDNLRGKKVGIIGLGNIGKRIAEMLSAMGVEIMYWSPNTADKRFQRYETIEELITDSDIIFPTVIANEATTGLLDKQKLSLLKNDAYFVSVVDEKIWDKDYLLQRVSENKLAGLGFESTTLKLKEQKGNIFVVPPFAWYSKQSLDENIKVWTETIISCLNNKPINVIK